MPVLAQAKSLWCNLFHKRGMERDLDDEISSHLELLTDQKIKDGLSPREARRAARVELGSLDRLKEEVRSVRAGVWLEALWQDIQFGCRMLRKNLGFAAVATLTLALGIGANAAIFSVVESMLLHPVPWKDADRILGLWEKDSKTKEERQEVSPANFLDWKAQALGSVFDYVAAWHFVYLNITGPHEPEQVEALAVTADYFRLLGYQAGLGRTFLPGEDQPGHEHSVILSHNFWQRQFGSDRALVGKMLPINGEPYAVVGILPPDFHTFRILNRELDLYVPLVLERGQLSRGDNTAFVYARLKRGVSLARAQSEIDNAYRRLAQEYPTTNFGIGARLIPLPEQWLIGVRAILFLLFAAVGLVLLIACSNVANLLIARNASRNREIAVRIALGAGRLRLIRQLQTESLLLAIGGGAIGLFGGYWIIALLNHLVPYTALNRTQNFRLDVPVLAFTFGLAILTSIVFGLAPALQATQKNLAEPFSSSVRSTSGNAGIGSFRELQIVFEVALAVMLLCTSTLILRSSLRLVFMNRGLDVKNVLTMQTWLPERQYADSGSVSRFYQQALARIRTLPGVKSASAANFPPLDVRSTGVRFATEHPSPSVAMQPNAQFAKVSVVAPDYFATMGIPLLSGRDFTEEDNSQRQGVVVVSEATAYRFWPGRNPIGSEIWPMFSKVQNFYNIESANQPLVVVGIVGDIRQDGTLDPVGLPQIYVPYLQNPSSIMSLLIRADRNPLDLTSAVQNQVWSIDKDQPVSNVRTMEDVVAETFSRPSATAWLISSFAGFALILASIGILGVISYSVGQRTHEIGIRIALGSRPKSVLGIVIRWGLRLVAVGVLIGLVAAFGFAHLLANLLYGISPFDPVTYVGVVLVLAAVAVFACYVPAHRATKLDPAVALRYE